MAERKITVVDTTLRDGSHAVRHSYTPEQVSDIAEGLDKCGVDMPECNVVPLGADFSKETDSYEEEPDERVRSISELGKYILMVGTLEPRKNHKLVFL